MSNENDGSNIFYYILLSIGGIFGVINGYRVINDPESEKDKVIKEKDKIIELLEKRILQYQKIIDHDTKQRDKLE